jgi:hypothetical protein
MVTAILPSLTDGSGTAGESAKPVRKTTPTSRNSVALSLESELTITPERYSRTTLSDEGNGQEVPGASSRVTANQKPGKPGALAGYVGLFTGCGALVALSLFLPLPAQFGEIDGVTPGQAVSYSFYVVGAVAFCVAVFVFFGLRDLHGEDGKGWRALFGYKGESARDTAAVVVGEGGARQTQVSSMAIEIRQSG